MDLVRVSRGISAKFLGKLHFLLYIIIPVVIECKMLLLMLLLTMIDEGKEMLGKRTMMKENKDILRLSPGTDG